MKNAVNRNNYAYVQLVYDTFVNLLSWSKSMTHSVDGIEMAVIGVFPFYCLCEPFAEGNIRNSMKMSPCCVIKMEVAAKKDNDPTSISSRRICRSFTNICRPINRFFASCVLFSLLMDS